MAKPWLSERERAVHNYTLRHVAAVIFVAGLLGGLTGWYAAQQAQHLHLEWRP